MTETSYCYCHDAEEPYDGTVYQICFECGHVYASGWDLLRAYHREAKTCRPDSIWDRVAYFLHRWTRGAGDIAFCQECIHDF